MKTRLFWKRFLIGSLLFTSLTGCQTLTPQPIVTPIPPTATPGPTSCDEVDGNCSELYFDGEKCTYKGPTELKSGSFTLLFFNEMSEGEAAVNFLRHIGDKTIQDAIDYIGEEPSRKPQPNWARGMGTWNRIPAGEMSYWEGNLEAGTYHMICARLEPLPISGWFGTGLIVED